MSSQHSETPINQPIPAGERAERRFLRIGELGGIGRPFVILGKIPPAVSPNSALQFEARRCEGVKRSPDKAVNCNYHDRHYHGRSQEHAKIAAVGCLAASAAKAASRVCSRATASFQWFCETTSRSLSAIGELIEA